VIAGSGLAYIALVIFAGSLIACADGSDDSPLVSDDSAQPTIAEPAPFLGQSTRPVRKCRVVKKTPVKDCFIYNLECEDGEDMIIICPIRNLGYITNPPRPI